MTELLHFGQTHWLQILQATAAVLAIAANSLRLRRYFKAALRALQKFWQR